MKKTSVEQEIALKIKRRIWSGEYPAGSFMPGQRDLVLEFGSSPVTISKALHLVRDMELIELTPKRGTRVLPVEERTEKGSVGIVYHGDTEPSRREAVLILNGIYSELNKYFQHYTFMSAGELNPKNNIYDLKCFSGIIFMEAANEEMRESIEECRRKQIPYVVANLESELEYNCTWVDHQKTTEMAVKVLAAFGHRRIAFISREFDDFFYRSALNGYKYGLKELGVPFDDKLVIVGDSAYPDDFANALKSRLSSNMTQFTAIVACRDYQAHGAWSACESLGLEVGRDMSIIGFDNISWQQESSNLTTFNEPATRLGKTAVEIIMRQMSYGYQDRIRCEIEAPLVLRSSVGPCLKESACSVPLELVGNTLLRK